MIFEPTAPNLNPFIKLYPYNKFFSQKRESFLALPFLYVKERRYGIRGTN